MWYENGIDSLFLQYWAVLAIDAVAVSNFRPFEGVGGPIWPFFGPQVILSLAPMALMQKKRLKSTYTNPATEKPAKS